MKSGKRPTKSPKIYDVIIVGGGPAGLQIASHLKGHNYIVLEGHKRVNSIINPVRASFDDTAKKYKFKDICHAYYDYVDFYSTGNQISIKLDPKVVFFDFWKLLKKLSKGVNIKNGMTVVDAKYYYNEDIEEKGILLRCSDGNEYFSRMIIDASGRGEIVGHSLGLDKSKIFCKCYIAYLKAKLPKNKAHYYISEKTERSAIWVEPSKNGMSQIGIADFTPYVQSTREDMKNRILWAMDHFKITGSIMKNTERIVTYPVDPIDTFVMDNLILIGDAAGQATPLLGEGVRIALESADMAADVVKEALRKEVYDKYMLSDYEKKWKEKFGKYYLQNYLIRKFLLKCKDKDYDILIKNMKKWNSKEKYKFIKSEITWKMFLKMIDGKLLWKIRYLM